jgi:tetratricopeptide (TPR) repeat protein
MNFKMILMALNLMLPIFLGLPGQVLGLEDWLVRGISYLESQHIDEAIDAFSREIEMNPDRVEAYNNRGIAWCEKGDYDQAIADYNRALEIDPFCTEAYNNRGVIWFYKKKYDLAINDYDKALGIDPHFAKAYSNRGAAWFSKGNLDLAIADYNRALEIDPNCAETIRQLAWIRSIDFGNAKESDSKAETAFSVQVGAFSSREKAEKLISQLKDKGYAARLLPLKSWGEKILYTVRIGDYATGEEAKNDAAAFSAKEGLPSIVRPKNEL